MQVPSDRLQIQSRDGAFRFLGIKRDTTTTISFESLIRAFLIFFSIPQSSNLTPSRRNRHLSFDHPAAAFSASLSASRTNSNQHPPPYPGSMILTSRPTINRRNCLYALASLMSTTRLVCFGCGALGTRPFLLKFAFAKSFRIDRRTNSL